MLKINIIVSLIFPISLGKEIFYLQATYLSPPPKLLSISPDVGIRTGEIIVKKYKNGTVFQ